MAYSGVFPSVDSDGQPLTGARASKAGSKLHGGPYALAYIRWESLKSAVDVFCLITRLIKLLIQTVTLDHGCSSNNVLLYIDGMNPLHVSYFMII